MHTSIRRLAPRVVSVLVAALLVTLLGAAPAAAARDAFVFNQDGSSVVQGSDPVCAPLAGGGSECKSTLMLFFEGRWRARNTGNPAYPDGLHIGDRVCVEFDTETFDAAGQSIAFVVEFGCPQDTGNLSFLGNALAALSPTNVTLEHSETGALRTVVVAGTWLADGPETRTKDRTRTHEESCFTVTSENTRSRPARAQTTIDGAPIQVDFATITKGRTTFRTTCF